MGLTMTGILIGAVLGFCFKVAILGPTMILLISAIAAFGLAQGLGSATTLSTMVLTTLGLQLGFLIAASVRGSATS